MVSTNQTCCERPRCSGVPVEVSSPAVTPRKKSVLLLTPTTWPRPPSRSPAPMLAKGLHDAAVHTAVDEPERLVEARSGRPGAADPVAADLGELETEMADELPHLVGADQLGEVCVRGRAVVHALQSFSRSSGRRRLPGQ